MIPASKANHAQRALFVILGVLSLVVGVIGIFLPLLPTVPFVILAAFLFSKGSKRWHSWLLHHPTLGVPVRRWREHGVIPLSAKIAATVMMSGSAAGLAWVPGIPPWARVAGGLCLAGPALFVWTRPSRPRRL